MRGKRKMNGKDCIIMNCIAYTTAVFILSILSVIGIVQNMDYRALLQLLLCTTIISVITVLINRIKGESGWKEIVFGIVQGTIVMIVIGGGIFQWFPWKWQYIIMVMAIFLVTYLISYAVQLWDNKTAAEKINKMIQEKRNENI